MHVLLRTEAACAIGGVHGLNCSPACMSADAGAQALRPQAPCPHPYCHSTLGSCGPALHANQYHTTCNLILHRTRMLAPTTAKFEDAAAGLALPVAVQPYLDAWRRAEQLVADSPAAPVVNVRWQQVDPPDKKSESLSRVHDAPACTHNIAYAHASTADVENQPTGEAKQLLRPMATNTLAPHIAGKAASVSAPTRELEGELCSGHEAFDWLLATISTIMSAEVGRAMASQQGRAGPSNLRRGSAQYHAACTPVQTSALLHTCARLLPHPDPLPLPHARLPLPSLTTHSGDCTRATTSGSSSAPRTRVTGSLCAAPRVATACASSWWYVWYNRLLVHLAVALELQVCRYLPLSPPPPPSTQSTPTACAYEELTAVMVSHAGWLAHSDSGRPRPCGLVRWVHCTLADAWELPIA